jgi:hypothetical protein
MMSLSFRSLVFAAGLLACSWSAGARADIVKTYDFSGTLETPFNGDDSVTGFFVLDQTNATLEDFSFTTPAFTFNTGNSFGEVQLFTPATTPNADFVALVTSAVGTNFVLLFETDLLNFDGSTFFTSEITVPGGTNVSGVIDDMPPFFNSPFTSGAATPVPEAPTWAAMALGFVALAGLGRKAALRARAQSRLCLG